MEELRLEKESALVKRVANYFSGKKFKVYFEIPIFSKICDVLCHDEKNNKIIAIEVKMSKWGNAIRQARIYQFGADEVFIAIPEIFIHRLQNNQAICLKYGIGIISINNKVDIKLKPIKSPFLIEKIRKQTIDTINCLKQRGENYACGV